MTFPVVAATNSGENATNATSQVISLPGSISVGDLLLVCLSIDGAGTAVSVDTGASGSNWSLSQYTSGSNSRIAVAYKIAEGSDALTFTSASEQSSHYAYRITGANTVEISSGATGNSANANPPDLALAGGATDALWIAFAGFDGIITASAEPGSFTDLHTVTATNSTGASLAVAQRELNASSNNPTSFTSGSARWHTFTIGVHYIAPAALGRSFASIIG